MKLDQLLWGLLTNVPGATRFSRGTAGTGSARYCYSVWLRHLVVSAENGLPTSPAVVAELGPGSSIGIGLAALLCGAERYFALDVMPHASLAHNEAVFHELVALFAERAPIPGPPEFPNIKPLLAAEAFPAAILTEERLAGALAPQRVERILRSIRDPEAAASVIRYTAPWSDPRLVRPGTVDLCYSQAVMEHVDDLEGAYRAMHAWLKPGGVISHDIDFRAHSFAAEWDGHWACSDRVWALMRGRRPYFINREPHSTHLRQLEACGFRVVCDRPSRMTPTRPATALAPRFRQLSDDDRTTATAFIQAVKR